MDVKYEYIVASDLDGTLLVPVETISDQNAKAIEEMGKRGICFAPCSGRTFSEMPESVLNNPHIRYYIGSDGSVIWDKQTGKRTEFGMKRNAVRPVLDLLDSYKTLLTVRSNGISYTDKELFNDEAFKQYRVPRLYGDFIKYYIKPTEDFSDFIRKLDSIEMICVFFSTDEEMDECKQKIEAMREFKVAASEPTNLEIFHRTAGKGNGLLALADMLGVPHENTIAVGDSKNDMDMIEQAGISLAMANASDDVKAAAHHTICHYKEHSAKYILDNLYFLLESKK